MAERADADAAPSQPPQPQGEPRSWWGAFFILLLVALIVFLALPLASPPWIVALQMVIRAGAPYGIVALFGGIVGLAEISSTLSALSP